jgi:hypothetical protein
MVARSLFASAGHLFPCDLLSVLDLPIGTSLLVARRMACGCNPLSILLLFLRTVLSFCDQFLDFSDMFSGEGPILEAELGITPVSASKTASALSDAWLAPWDRGRDARLLFSCFRVSHRPTLKHVACSSSPPRSGRAMHSLHLASMAPDRQDSHVGEMRPGNASPLDHGAAMLPESTRGRLYAMPVRAAFGKLMSVTTDT